MAETSSARLAAPGEFTLRAYLNGRIDLAQAEAIGDLINAATPLQARAAFDQLEGTLTGRGSEASILFAIGLLVVSSVDNVLRPVLARWGHLQMHAFVVLVSMLGGLALFGGWGLMLGPLVVRLAIEGLRIAKEEELV